MPLILSSQNAVSYLKQRQICAVDSQLAQPITPEEYKNFNLVVKFADGSNYLVKQERFDGMGKPIGRLRYEWIIHLFFQRFTQLDSVKNSISQAVYFDKENRILVLKYFSEHTDLFRFYLSRSYYTDRVFPVDVAEAIGANLGLIHQLTFAQSESKEFLNQLFTEHNISECDLQAKPNFVEKLAKFSPEIFAYICPESLEFFKLYQRFPSLHQAVNKLHQNYQAVCLTHQDLRLGNYLIHDSGASNSLKLIDWEFFAWGDPAFDLGTAIANYLKLWLASLYVDRDTDLNVALSLATCPLERVQPSLKALIQSYLIKFPRILAVRPHYIEQVVQFAGLNLVKHLQHSAEHHQPFDNRGICALQVAKSLLCYPEQSIETIFGVKSSELITDS